LVNAPTVAENTNALYTQFGGKSTKVTAAANGEGIETIATTIVPSGAQPHFSGYFSLWLVQGSVRVELIDITNNRVYPTGAEGRAVTTVRDTWVALGVAGIDLKAVASASVKLRIVADAESGAEFYVDACQLTQTGGQQPFFGGDGAVRLWFEGNNYLLDHAAPLVTVKLNVYDLTRFDPTTWPFDDIVPGGPVQFTDDAVSIDVATRVVKRTRDLLQRVTTTVELSNRTDTLTDRMVRPVRRRRFGQQAGVGFDEIGVADPSIGPASAGEFEITYPIVWDADTAFVRIYTVETESATPPTPGETGEYDAGNATPSQSEIVIATTSGWYRKSVFVAYTRDGVRGRTVVLGPTTTVSGSGPSAGPSTLACASPTDTTVPLTWTNGDTTAQTRIYRDQQIVKTLAANVAAWTDTGRTPGTSYDYEAAHVKNGQEHATRSSATCVTTAGTLTAPTDHAAYGDTTEGVILGVEAAEETAHTIWERSPNGSTGWEEVADWPPGQCDGEHGDGSGLNYFRCFHRKEGWNDSTKTGNNTATYYANDTPETLFPCP
jgi:hypothetical protein